MNHLTVQQLSAALDGSLGGPSLESVVHHLAHCHECRDRQARLARNDDVLRRLLAQDPHEFFLDDLEKRVEALLLAITRGLPVPPMVTSSPLQAEEDPLQPSEPPLPERPELGLAGVLAHQAGFGRIGLKPAASAQAPESDPGEAQRLLEALGSGDTGDFTELPAHQPSEPAAADGPVFDLPDWIKQGASPRTGQSEPRPREVQKVQLFLEHLDDGTAQLPHEAVEEMFRRESAAAAAPPPAERAPQPAAPAAGTTPHPDRAYQPPASSAPQPERAFPPPAPTTPHPDRAYQPPAAPPPVVRPPAAQPLAEVPATEPAAAPSAPASRAPEFPRLRAPAADLDPVPSRPSRAARPEVVTKETPWRASSANLRVQTAPPARPDTPVVPPVAAAQPPVHREPEPAQEPPRRAVPNVKPTPRFAGAWLLATVSVGGLLVLVLTLQFLPPADAPGAAAWRGFEMPQVQFAPGDSLDTPEPRPTGPSVRSAAMPLPVESPVPTGEFPLDGSPADSATAIPDSLRTAADTIGVAHGR